MHPAIQPYICRVWHGIVQGDPQWFVRCKTTDEAESKTDQERRAGCNFG